MPDPNFKDPNFKARTYTQEPGPAAMPFQRYAAECHAKLINLLDREAPEPEVQCFLDRNPCLVPGAWTPGSPPGHYPLHCALISQPRLPSLGSRQPDFMWLATDSLTWYPTLIEIEAPSKRIFTASGVPCSKFTQARNQLAQWRNWFNTPTNVQQFMDSYRIPDTWRHAKTFRIHMILVYGRRQEFQDNPQLSKQRGSLLPGADEELMSYDRLRADEKLKEAVTVRMGPSSRYCAIAVPPVFTLNPAVADRLLHVDGIEKAIDRCDGISVARKKFLRHRLQYWKTWAARPQQGVIGGPDTYDE